MPDPLSAPKVTLNNVLPLLVLLVTGFWSVTWGSNSAGFTELSVAVRGEEGTQLLRRKALDARLLGIPGPCGHCPTSPHPHFLQRTL